jgi:hypothetical protein
MTYNFGEIILRSFFLDKKGTKKSSQNTNLVTQAIAAHPASFQFALFWQ